jgi:hypothetical protein
MARVILCSLLTRLKCDTPYHLGCLDPPLSAIPDGEWFCPNCIHTPGAPIGVQETPSQKAPPVKKPAVKKAPIMYLEDDGLDDDDQEDEDSYEDSDDEPRAGRKRKASTRSRATRELSSRPLVFCCSNRLSKTQKIDIQRTSYVQGM